MADIGGLQLLPETRKKIEIEMPGQNRLLILAIVFLVVIVGLYFGLSVYRQKISSSVTVVDGQLADLERSRDKKLESKILDLRQRFSVINPLLAAHFFWSDAFIKIQSVAEPQIQVQSINADAVSKKVLFKALAANYTTIARQIAAFYTVDSITDVVLNKVQSQPNGLDVTMQINFDISKFLIKNK